MNVLNIEQHNQKDILANKKTHYSTEDYFKGYTHLFAFRTLKVSLVRLLNKHS